MKKSIFLIVCAGLFLSLLAGCQKKTVQSDLDTSKIVKQIRNTFIGDGAVDNFKLAAQNLIDVLETDVLPIVTSEDKAELTKIIKYFQGVEALPSDEMEDENTLMEVNRKIMHASDIVTKLSPNDFDTHLHAASNYQLIAGSIGVYDFSSDKAKDFHKEFSEKAIQAAKELVEKFPSNPMSYGQLAHTTLYTGGDMDGAVRILNKCLELDNNFEYCKDLLEKFK